MLKKILNTLLPATCVLCSAQNKREIDLCHLCEADLPWLKNTCQQCAQPLIITTHSFCGKCLQHEPSFNRTIALFHYQQPLDYLISSLKFQQQLLFARLLGELLMERLKIHYQYHPLPNCIIPVPLHKKRLQERGFNQAMEIARPIAKKLKLPIDIKNCQRIKFTVAQSDLPADERLKNVKDAFTVNSALKYQHVAIVDDVMTTGHTIEELSKELRKSGVKQIDVWCIARTNL